MTSHDENAGGGRKVERTVCANAACERVELRALGRCQACYAFYRRHGRDVRPHEMRQRKRTPSWLKALCLICGERPIYYDQRCRSCFAYRQRRGRDRKRRG